MLLGIAGAAAEELAPVALLALLKHPLVGGEGEERVAWLERVRGLDSSFAVRGRRRGLPDSMRRFAERSVRAWQRVRPRVGAARQEFFASRMPLARFARRCSASAAQALAGDRGVARAGRADGRRALAELRPRTAAQRLSVTAEDAVPLLRQLLDERAVRPPYGGHPRIFIWGLLEARLQRADLVVLGGLNEGVWPALPAPDPVAAAEGPGDAWDADPRDPDRPCRARFRQRARRSAKC